MTAKQLFADDTTWLSLGTFVVAFGFFLFMTLCRASYLKFVAAEHRLIKALGIPEHVFASTRRMEESRGYVIAWAILAFAALAVLVAGIVLHIHFGDKWPIDS